MIGNENIIIKSFEGLNYLQFKVLNELGIKHAYTLKSEGFDFSHGVPEEEFSYLKLAKALNCSVDFLLGINGNAEEENKHIFIIKSIKRNETVYNYLLKDTRKSIKNIEKMIKENK